MTEPGKARANPSRWLPPTILLLAAVALGAAWAGGARDVYEATLHAWIVSYDAPPFADAAGVTGMAQCERLGHETYLANPCDPKARAFVYTPTWKLLAYLPITRAWTLPITLAWIGLFLAALYALPRAPGRHGVAIMIAAMLSPATIMVVNYGNSEMLIFAIAVTAALLLRHGWRARRLAYSLIGMAGLLKYFPALALIAAAREQPGRLLAISAVALAVTLSFIWLAGEQLLLALQSLGAMSPLSLVFGIRNIGELLVMRGLAPELGWAARTILTVGILTGGALLSRNAGVRAATADMAPAQRDCLLVGGVLLTGAYLLTQNVDYRQIYTIMALPALCSLRAANLPRRFAALPWLAVALMWEFPLRYHSRALFAYDSPAHSFVTALGVVLREAGWLAYATALVALIIAALGPVLLLDRWPGRLSGQPSPSRGGGSPRR